MKDRPPGIKRYVVGNKQYIYKDRIRIHAPFGTLQFLERVAEIEARKRRVKSNRDHSVTLQQAYLQFQHSDRYREHRLRARARFEVALTWLTPSQNKIPVIAIDAAFARRLRDRTLRDRGRNAANMMLNMLQATVTYCVEIGILAENVISLVPKVPQPRRSTLGTARRVIQPIRGALLGAPDSKTKKNSSA